jgi:hypothetical protein
MANCEVIGHGIEVDARFYCCAHCARKASGNKEAKDRVETHA